MKIQYIGKIPVRLNGIRGEIKPGTTVMLPEKIALNLLLDKENWRFSYKPEVIIIDDITPEDNNPGEERKKKKKEAK